MYKNIVKVNNIPLTKKYIASLNKQQREALIIPLYNEIRKIGWLMPDFEPDILKKSYQKLLNYKPNINSNEAYGNNSLATDICKYFCRNHFYNTTETKNKTLLEVFNTEELLLKICKNRLGLDWYEDSPLEPFNITPKMVMFQGPRSMRLVPQISFFKPNIAKHIYLKYSNEDDLVYDFSAGFGARAIGAISCNRRYIGIDPLTSKSITEMLEFLNIDRNKYIILDRKSESFRDCSKESIDFAFSSPPYYNQEIYSNDKNQAYNNGEDYFYNIYWKFTLLNIYEMLKPKSKLALNISVKYPKMLSMTKDIFGDYIDIFNIRLVRSHLNKTGKEDAQKFEPIYIFKKEI